jgi:riboflavin transporter FmnP
MRNTNVRKIVVTAMLAAVASVLMFVDFSVPIMPSFIKLDISEMPALIATFAVGPLWGGAVCFIKNVVNMALHGTTGGVGELCNFLLGLTFVLPAGFIYKYNKTRKGALIGSLVGAVCMAVLSLPINYFITYPMYAKFMPIDAIIGMYQEIFPGVDGLFSCLLIFNVPFTFVKGLICSAITFIVYKRISYIIKGRE